MAGAMELSLTNSGSAAGVGVAVLGSGSQGNAVAILTGDTVILLDAGFSGIELHRRLESAGIEASRISAIVITHEHDDHIKGLRVSANQWQIPVFCNRLTAAAIRDRSAAPERLQLFTPGAPFDVGKIRIQPFSIPHDAVDPVGFTFTVNGVKIGVATDLGHASHLVCQHLLECDLLILESNHDVAMLHNSGRPWSLKKRILGRHGHLSNDDSMALLQKVIHPRTRHVIFAHASQECNRYELIEKCASTCLAGLGRTDLRPLVARQAACLPVLWL